MSESDSFISEVSEEVRRDRLYGYLRRYGWIAVVLILVLVGGAAWNEYRKASARDAAQATGNALLGALEEDAAEARAAALAEITVTGDSAAVAALLTAASQQEAGDIAAAAATLDALAVNGDVPQVYRDLAAIKSAMLDTGNPQDRRLALDALSQPGAPFRLIALEQLAYMDIAAGEIDAAAQRLNAIIEDAGVSATQRDRVSAALIALGQPVPDAMSRT